MMRPARWFVVAALLPLAALLLLPACDTGSSGSSSSGTIGTIGGGGGGGGGTTPDTTPPLDVTNFDATATGISGQISLTWTPSTSTDAASYQVTWTPATGGPAQPVSVSPATESTLIINGLSDGTTYTVTIQTVDTSANVSTGVSDTVTPGSSSVYVEAAPHGGIYPGSVDLLFNYTGAGTVYYTTDGTDPSLSSPLTWTTGGTPITLSANTRLKYILALAAGSVSPVRSDIYEFDGGAGPRYNKFSGMRVSRVGHTATRLKTAAAGEQDDVIVIGGIDLNSPTPWSPLAGETERFDLDFEHFDPGPTLATPRWNHAAALLPGGLVLVTGGQVAGVTNWWGYNYFSPADASDSAVVYNAATNTTGSPTTMVDPRYYQTATTLYDGRVLVTGGMTGEVLVTVNITNESPSKTALTLPWDTLASASPAVRKYDLVEATSGAAQGEVAVITDYILSDPLDATTEDTLTVTGFITELNSGDGIRIIRGRGTRTAELYNSTGMATAAAGSMGYTRYGHTATLLDDGTVLVVGGTNDEDAETIGDLLPEIYHPVDDDFRPTFTGDAAEMASNRFFHTATKLKDGKVLIAGGIEQGNAIFKSSGLEGTILSSVDLYDPATKTIARVGAMTTPRFLHSATLLDDGRVLITGGVIAITDDGGSVIGETADLYDPDTQSFTSVLTNDFRGHNRSVTLSDGRGLVMGGGSFTADVASDLAEVFIPAADRFEATAHGIAGERTYGGVATVIPDGRILLTGGQTDTRMGPDRLVAGPVLASAEVFTMSSISSSLTAGDMTVPRRFHTATRLVDPTADTKAAWHGQILVAGGENEDGAVAACDLFDPSTTLFTATAPLKTARYDHTATWLPDGRILVTGGGATGSPLASGELYNPTSGTWSDAANTMSKGRTQHQAVLIPANGAVPVALAGTVLIMGGNDIDDDTAEYFDPTDDLFKPLASAMGTGRRGFAAAVRTYSKGLAQFTNTSTTVYGFGTGWSTATAPLAPAVGDLIRSDADGTFYYVAAVAGDPDGAGPADATITLSTAFAGTSTIGFQAYTLVKPYVFVAGGEGGSVTTDMFDGLNDVFVDAGDMGTAGLHGRYALTMDAVADGRMLLTGGYAATGDGRLYTLTAAPATGTYASPALDANAGMIYHTSARPPNGFVLVLRAHSAQVFFPD